MTEPSISIRELLAKCESMILPLDKAVISGSDIAWNDALKNIIRWATTEKEKE